jgi:hypothetical protein
MHNAQNTKTTRQTNANIGCAEQLPHAHCALHFSARCHRHVTKVFAKRHLAYSNEPSILPRRAAVSSLKPCHTHTHTTGDNQSTSTYNFIPQQSMPKPHRPPRLTANVTQIYAGPYTLRSDRPNLTLPSLTDQTGCFAVRLEAPPVQTRIDASQVLGLHSAHTHRMGTRG